MDMSYYILSLVYKNFLIRVYSTETGDRLKITTEKITSTNFLNIILNIIGIA